MTASTIKERPILFSAPMIRAILAGRKIVTRRIVKPQPPAYIDKLHGHELSKRAPYTLEDDNGNLCGKGFQDDNGVFYRCPYGSPGDRLVVRETWRTAVGLDDKSPRQIAEAALDANYRTPWCPIKYEADGATRYTHVLGIFGGEWGRTRVSIHMPFWASRITLEVTDVRVERLQDITPNEAISEGLQEFAELNNLTGYWTTAFARLWDKINGPGSFDSNPWVWAISFKKVSP